MRQSHRFRLFASLSVLASTACGGAPQKPAAALTLVDSARDQLSGLSVAQLQRFLADSPGSTRAAARLGVLLANSDSAKSERHGHDEQELRSLMRKFEANIDEVRASAWFTPRSQAVGRSWSRSFIGAMVASDGEIWLQSHYHGDSWLFHDRITARVGDRVIEAGPQPSSRIDHQNTDVVWETVTFRPGEDNGLLAALVASDPRARVIIQQENEKTYRLATFTESDRAALRDCWRLSELVKELGQATTMSIAKAH
jgi:hypothetical protein